MSYEKPQVMSVSARELLSALGPARAWGYDGNQQQCHWWDYLSGKCK